MCKWVKTDLSELERTFLAIQSNPSLDSDLYHPQEAIYEKEKSFHIILKKIAKKLRNSQS